MVIDMLVIISVMFNFCVKINRVLSVVIVFFGFWVNKRRIKNIGI